jgi:hypothetical protein
LEGRFTDRWCTFFVDRWWRIIVWTQSINIENESTFNQNRRLSLIVGHNASDNPIIALRVSHYHHEWNTDYRDFHTSVTIRCCCYDSHLSNGEWISGFIVKLNFQHATQMRLNNYWIHRKPSERMRPPGDSGELMLIICANDSLCNSGLWKCVIANWILTTWSQRGDVRIPNKIWFENIVCGWSFRSERTQNPFQSLIDPDETGENRLHRNTYNLCYQGRSHDFK